MKRKSKMVALGGILAAICLICLYLAVYLPANRLFFYSLASIFVSFIILESGTKYGWSFYIATSALSMFIIPNKISLLPYLVFFGIYGIIKCYIESINLMPLELILKGLFFLSCEGILYILYSQVFIINISLKLPLYGVFGIFLAVFFIYDYIYTKIVAFYKVRFMS
ncbi:MAG: hypothetical protein GX340_06820 [Clostridiales bacterium]|nr:hypothetical protein [Clostridiales bacterium]